MNDRNHTEFMQVGEFVADFGENELEHTDDLVGKRLNIHLENGWIIRHHFAANQALTWEMIEGLDTDPAAPTSASETYRATNLREGFYLVDFVKGQRPTQSVSLVLDFKQGICTAVIADMPSREETLKPLFQRVLDKEILTPMRATYLNGAIDKPIDAQTPRHQRTDELVGKRLLHRYGSKDAYEHIYLSPEFYTWNCTEGPEVGLADTDQANYFKLDDELYLFVWLEKVIPTEGLIMVDLKSMKTSGKIFGYEGDDFGKTSNTPVGAVLTVLNKARYS